MKRTVTIVKARADDLEPGDVFRYKTPSGAWSRWVRATDVTTPDRRDYGASPPKTFVKVDGVRGDVSLDRYAAVEAQVPSKQLPEGDD